MAKRPRCKICLVETEINKDRRCRSCQDALDATNAGMTYGKYMGQKAYVEQKKNLAPLPPGWKRCPHCGKRFYPTHGLRIYCSTECGYKARNTKYKQPIAPRTCAVCGKEFTPSRNDRRIKYCGQDCYELALLELNRVAAKRRAGAKNGTV